MPGEIAASIASSVGDRLYNSLETRALMDKKFKMQKDLMNYQWQHDSPVAQMRRFKAAGLNPDLMYGQIAAGQAVPSIETDTTTGSQFTSAAGQGMRIKKENEILDSQIDVNASQSEKNRAEADEATSRAQYYGRLREMSFTKEQLMQAGIRLNDASVQKINQDIQESMSRVRLNQANIDYIGSKKMEQDIFNEKAAERFEAEISKEWAEAGYFADKAAQIRQAIQHTALNFAQEYRILCNEANLSDEQFSVASAELAEEAYRQAEIKGLIKWNDKTKEYELTEQGEKLKSVDATINKVSKVVEFITRNVSRFYSHHTFENFTPTKDLELDDVEYYNGDDVRVGRTIRTKTRR